MESGASGSLRSVHFSDFPLWGGSVEAVAGNSSIDVCPRRQGRSDTIGAGSGGCLRCCVESAFYTGSLLAGGRTDAERIAAIPIRYTSRCLSVDRQYWWEHGIGSRGNPTTTDRSFHQGRSRIWPSRSRGFGVAELISHQIIGIRAAWQQRCEWLWGMRRKGKRGYCSCHRD